MRHKPLVLFKFQSLPANCLLVVVDVFYKSRQCKIGMLIGEADVGKMCLGRIDFALRFDRPPCDVHSEFCDGKDKQLSENNEDLDIRFMIEKKMHILPLSEQVSRTPRPPTKVAAEFNRYYSTARLFPVLAR